MAAALKFDLRLPVIAMEMNQEDDTAEVPFIKAVTMHSKGQSFDELEAYLQTLNRSG